MNWDRRTVPTVAVSLIRRVEGVKLAAYKDSVGVWTIGAGSTFMPSGRRVQAGDRITDQQCNDLLAEQCEQWVAAVENAVSWPINDAQAAVLISFVHNLGANSLQGSTLAAMANAGKMGQAADQLNGWCIAGGKIALGLMRRREYERRLFMGEAVESQASYNAVWQLDMTSLMPAYQRAFTEARAWGWKPNTEPSAASKPVTKPVAQVSSKQSAVTADDLNDQQLASIQGEPA